VISERRVSVDYKKVQAVMEWLIPKTLKAPRGFLGLTGYCRKFIRGYGTLAAPLTALTKKNSFHWSREAQEAFEALKHALTSPLALVSPDFKGNPLLLNVMLHSPG